MEDLPEFVRIEVRSSPIVESKVIALMFSEHKIASLSTRLLSSMLFFRADSITHMSQRLMLTARRFARFSGEPLDTNDKITTCKMTHS